MPRRGVEDDITPVIRFGIIAKHDAVYLLQLFHQVLFIMESACRVDEQDVRLLRLARSDGVINDRRRIRSFFVLDDADVAPVRPNRELFRRRRTEGIRRREHDALSHRGKIMGELPDRRGLPHAVYARNKNAQRIFVRRDVIIDHFL